MTSTASSPHPRKALLVLNACEERLSIVLGEAAPGQGFGLLAAEEFHAPGRANSFLAPSLARLLDIASLAPTDLAGAACVRGPGSFTGLRITLSFAAGLLAGGEIPLAGLEYLPLIAASAPPLENGTLAVATYARSTQVYLQSFQAGSLDPLAPPQAMEARDAAEFLAGLGDETGPLTLVGSGLRKNPEAFAELAGSCRLLPPLFDTPRPEAMLVAARDADYATAAPELLYIRPSDAEANLRSIAENRGIDPDEAARRLAQLTGQ